MTIRAVCFDATGTLIEIRESVGTVYSRAAANVGVKLPAWRLDDAFARVLRHAPPLASAGVTGESRAAREAAEIAWWCERVRQTFQAADSTVEFADPKAFALSLFETYRRGEAWRERPGARDLLADLRAEGVALGLASNFDHRLPKILEDLDLIHFFDVIEIPSLHGRAKPDRSVFVALASALGARLDELAYLGDDAQEVLEAIGALGLRVFDVREVASLAEIADRLRTERAA
jgi:putative hydrolase of the HAD superfamily